MAKEIKVAKHIATVLNRHDLSILYENICKDSGIEDYHADIFIKILEISKYDGNNVVLLLKSISKYIIPIIAKKDEFSISIQFNHIIVCLHNNNLINVTNNEMIAISGIKINTKINKEYLYDVIRSGLYNNYTRYIHSYYGHMNTDFTYNNVLELMQLDCDIVFEEKTILNTLITVRKLCLFYEFIHNFNTNILYGFVQYDTKTTIKNHIAMPFVFKRPLYYEEMCKVLKKKLNTNNWVFINEINNYEFQIIYTKIISGIPVLDFEPKQYDVTNYIEENKRNLLKYLVFKLFKNKKQELTLDEKNILKLNYEKEVQYLKFNINNKCDHIPILKKSNRDYSLLLPFVDLSTEQVMVCKKCNIPILCPHTVDIIDNGKTGKKTDILIKYIDRSENQYSAYCKLCGEQILSIDSDLKQAFIDGTLVKTNYDSDLLGPIVWKAVNIIVKKYFDVKYPDIMESLIYGLKDTILPYIRDEESKLVDNKSIPLFKQKMMYIIIDIYVFCSMIVIMLKNKDLITTKYIKKGGDSSIHRLSAKYKQLFERYDNTQIIKLIIKAINIKKPPCITFNDIQERLPYSKHLDQSTTIHNGQRKLFISEVQFLTKCFMTDKKCEYVIYAGSAPGHKTHFLSIMFPSLKFILVDPNRFELKLENNESHREIKHDDITHLYYNFPTKSHTYNDNKTLDSFDKKEIDMLIKFIKHSSHKIFIVEDFMSDTLANIFSNLDSCFYINDIRSAVDGVSDFDITWNTAMNYNWMCILSPILSSLKYRLPFKDKKDTSVATYYNKFKSTFVTAKKFGIDFIDNYKHKNGMVMCVGDIYLQAWAGVSSAETRLYIHKDNLYKYKLYEYNEYEEKLFYYNHVERNFVYHNNDNYDVDLHFCNCNDCSLENNVLMEYIQNVNKKKDVIYYVKKLDIITERPLKLRHKNNIYKVINIDSVITILGSFKKEKRYNFGEMLGNKGTKGGSEDMYSENKLILNFINIVKKDRQDIVDEIPNIGDLIKHIFVKVYKTIRTNVHAVHHVKQLELNFLLDDSIYKYIYYIHRSYIGVEKYDNTLKIVNLPVDSTSHVLTEYTMVKNNKKDMPYNNYKYESYTCFLNIIQNKKYINTGLLKYDNARKLFMSRLYKYKPVMSIYIHKKNKLESCYGDIFCKTGNKHNFNIFILNDGKENYEITEKSSWISDISKNKRLVASKLVDILCSKCKLSKNNITNKDDHEILKIVSETENITSFYNSFNYKCPKGKYHKFIKDTCAKCELTKIMIFNKDISYYKKWFNTIHETYVDEIEKKHYYPIDYDIPKENHLKQMSNLYNTPINIIKNIGMYEQQFFTTIEKDNIQNTGDYSNRHTVLNGYLVKTLSEYSIINGVEKLKALGDIKIQNNVSIIRYFEIYDSMIMKNENPEKISLFVLNTISIFFISLWKHITEEKYNKDEQARIKKIITGLLNNILDSEIRKCKYKTIHIKYETNVEDEEIDEQTEEIIAGIEDPFSMEDLDISSKDIEDITYD